MTIPLNHQPVHIVGGGLAGSEAAYFLAASGIKVRLYEMRPKKETPAHKTGQLAELVCSNSLKSKDPHSAPGILKREMEGLGSMILEAAKISAVPSGDALSVDRDRFSDWISNKIKSHENIELINEEVEQPFETGLTLIATGPLTAEKLSLWLSKKSQKDSTSDDLYFYDAISPIVDAESIQMDKVFLANRYGKGGEEAYLNCPFTEKEYLEFVGELSRAEQVPSKNFEKEIFFQGCQPIEAIAKTGIDTLRYGPMKPVGLVDPRTGKKAYAVVQLRPENLGKTAYNIVGFQTKLRYGEQSKVFRKIPGLEKAEFLRLGSIHRNTYLCAPKVLHPDFSLIRSPNVFVAGQLTGVEGYVESAATGLIAALSIFSRIAGYPFIPPPPNTALGALVHFLLKSDSENFQPNNIQFGLFDPVYFENLEGLKKDQMRLQILSQSLLAFQGWQNKLQISRLNDLKSS